MSESNPTPEHPNQRGETPSPGFLGRLRHFELREAWWTFLDAWELNKALRWTTYTACALLFLIVIAWFGFYPLWAQRNAVRMARQWLAAGQLGYAAETVQKALEANPKQHELWRLAAEIARRSGHRTMEVQYLHEAVAAQPGNNALVLEWASAALRADLVTEAEHALAEIPAGDLARSSFAQRLLGELARRKNQLPEAIARFETALKIDGSGGVNELPLGLCLVATRDAGARARGLRLLENLVRDPEWGTGALRVLLEDASRQNDLPAMARWAEALRTNPRCTVGDMPNCLSALAKADAEKFASVVAQLKADHLATPDSAAQLAGWLNQIGRSRDALAWLATLPEANVQRPPLALAKAEALRLTPDWQALSAWCSAGDWGADLNYLRWAYELKAAQSLGADTEAEVIWRKLQNHAKTDGVHALFAGTTLFSWGMNPQAELLWWEVAGQSNNLAGEALGILVRFYQVERDAQGQFRVFSRLHALRPKDAAVANNFAFFAALTGNREQVAEQVASDNSARYPADPVYRATYAFVLLRRGRVSEALRQIEPLSGDAGKSAAVAFAYGLVLAEAGQKPRAREVLSRLDPAALTTREIELIQSALRE